MSGEFHSALDAYRTQGQRSNTICQRAPGGIGARPRLAPSSYRILSSAVLKGIRNIGFANPTLPKMVRQPAHIAQFSATQPLRGEWLFCLILRTPAQDGVWSNSPASTAMLKEEIMDDREIRAALDRHWAASDTNDLEAERRASPARRCGESAEHLQRTPQGASTPTEVARGFATTPRTKRPTSQCEAMECR